ncbi:MAG: CHAT domain-containing protein, partial [Acidobacteriota bacterium]
PDATTEALQEHLGSGPRLLHIAAHGIADALYPARSHLQLEPAGRGGRLEAAGLAALDLRSVDLALLAACESGRGGVRRGEGMLGLTWATLSAGARNALISHWRVDAAATSDLMVALHRRLAAGERDVARALQDSQLELAGEPATAHPFYWAGFSLVGSGQLSAASLPAGGLDRSP